MPITASVSSSALQGLVRVSTTVVSSGATACATIERSAWALGEDLIVFTVKTTSEAVSGSPSLKVTSPRILNVQVRWSSEQEYSVARSFTKFMSSSVAMRVDWMSGSCTCSPQPQSTQGSKPADGSFSELMAIVTWRVGSTLVAAGALVAPDPPQPASALATASAAPPTNVRLPTSLFSSMLAPPK